ncbi:glycerophosphodiester phosphodiesterase [Dyadobacter sandarakinus]|uniref:Glycerophosphodiester phosphodiesterase n=1 Tax=Dyadobacter sandarakinus TaxID=2747268 RepID=A0ABX7IDC5_9BACT|nr:glycerophosphodiester phosphodiesterase family protein [Dyadobacter sandarakinus]QRR03805.1 glycerophosphodiester phosphodiesterase [Dyadobacter sandarakinus]
MKKMILAMTLAAFSLTSFDGMSQNKNKVIAHRGAWKNTGATENSIAALEHAIKMKCYGSEFDVHMSADSVLYVLHDHSIKGTNIETTGSAELSQIKLDNGEPLPTLEAYLKAGAKQKKTRLILEIKTSKISKERSLALAAKCVKMVKDLKVAGITDYIAFDFDVCKKVKELAPKAHVEYLMGDKTPEEIRAAGLDGIDYHYTVIKKNEDYIRAMHDQKMTTNVWTVNDEETMKWLLEKNVDFITTNEPELLLRITK